jgi:hypothetical protein
MCWTKKTGKTNVTVHRYQFTVVRKNLKSVFWGEQSMVIVFPGNCRPSKHGNTVALVQITVVREKGEKRLFGERPTVNGERSH